MKKFLTLFFVVFCFQIAKADPNYAVLFYLFNALVSLIGALFIVVPLNVFLFKNRTNEFSFFKLIAILYAIIHYPLSYYFIHYIFCSYYDIEEEEIGFILYLSLFFIFINLPILYIEIKKYIVYYKKKRLHEKNYLEKPPIKN